MYRNSGIENPNILLSVASNVLAKSNACSAANFSVIRTLLVILSDFEKE